MVVDILDYVGPPFRESNSDLRKTQIKAIQTRLNSLGFGVIAVDGLFMNKTTTSVKMLQMTNKLLVDGVVDYYTWQILFGRPDMAETKFLGYAIKTAVTQIGIKETTHNRGPKIDLYVRSVGLDPETRPSWCVAFAYWCFDQAAALMRRRNPIPRTGGVISMWTKAPAWVKRMPQEKPKPGWLWLADHGQGKGHMGIVRAVDPIASTFLEVSGNTNESGSRDGTSVAQKLRRSSDASLGWLDYSYILDPNV